MTFPIPYGLPDAGEERSCIAQEPERDRVLPGEHGEGHKPCPDRPKEGHASCQKARIFLGMRQIGERIVLNVILEPCTKKIRNDCPEDHRLSLLPCNTSIPDMRPRPELECNKKCNAYIIPYQWIAIGPRCTAMGMMPMLMTAIHDPIAIPCIDNDNSGYRFAVLHIEQVAWFGGRPCGRTLPYDGAMCDSCDTDAATIRRTFPQAALGRTR